MASRAATSTEKEYPKTLLVGVYAPYNRNASPEHYYEEFLSLVKTLGWPYEQAHFVKLRAVDNNMFFSKGKLGEIKTLCNAHDIEQVIISELLSPVQERNLEEAFGALVWDRERIILEIFKKSAHTSEGKIQVEMAEIDYLKTRIIGKGRELAQQEGIIGSRGPGETAKEELKRHFAEKMRQARKRLDTLERARITQRKQRTNRNIPLVCIIGYTNAGKSSLLNRITNSMVYAQDELFATLDTTTRELFLKPNSKILISDTVGFIDHLPHNLVSAFKSTLDELAYATLLLHVIDISNPAWQNHIHVVNETLKELNIDKPVLYIFNKIDKCTDDDLATLKLKIHDVYQPAVYVCTTVKGGADPLMAYLKRQF